MNKVGIRELKAQVSELVRHVREEGAVYEITVRGQPAARLVPVETSSPMSRTEIDLWNAKMDDIADELAEIVDGPTNASDIIRDERGSV